MPVAWTGRMNNRKEVELKPGDIVLVHNRGLAARIIQLLTWSRWNHAAMIFSKTARGNRYVIVESERKGVIARVLKSKYRMRDIMILRDPTLDDDIRWSVAMAGLEMEGRPYDFLLPLRLIKRFGFRYSIKVLYDVARHHSTSRVPHIRNRWVVCSEMIQEAYHEAGVILIPDDQLLVPGRIEKLGFLEIIWKGRNVP